MSSQIKNLTEGRIGRGIIRLASPLIAASLAQMTYSITDMFWLGHLGSKSVAAVGASFFFVWLANSFSYIGKSGAEVMVSQSLGANDLLRAKVYAKEAVRISIVLALFYMVLVLVCAPRFLSFFHLEKDINRLGVLYLRSVSPSLLFSMVNNTFAGILYGLGNSKLPFRILISGLVCNIILDPLCIYGYSYFPHLGVQGAAIATTVSQLLVFSLFLKSLFGSDKLLTGFHLFAGFNRKITTKIIRLGFPITAQSALFSFISMWLTSMTAQFGHVAVAVSSLGAQLEAISWMTASGLSTALGSFTGQNYGANHFDRMHRSFFITLLLACSIGLLAFFVFFFFGGELFSFFMPEVEAIQLGAIYLFIQSFSQLFMEIENVSAGGLNGIGKTYVPASIGAIFNLLRIPAAYFLIYVVGLGVVGIWWAVSISSIFKGTLCTGWYYLELRKLRLKMS